ncbi:MAG: TonB-dependent receptor, partial [Burkholderiaceae bacterium]
TTLGSPDPFVPLPADYLNITRVPQASYEGRTVGVYAQDVIQFAPAWKLLLGARYDDFKADYDRIAPLGDLSRTDRVWSYRTGLMFQPHEEVNYYLSYGTSFNPSAELYQLDDRSTNTPPEKSRNIELGAKWDLAQGNLSLRTSLSRSEKTNERNTDLANPTVFLLSGKRHTDALEFEAAGRITPQWEVFGAVALMRAKVDQASGQQGPNQGKVPVNTPDYTASLWSTYKLGNWKIGGGIEGVGERYANALNTTVVPAYVRVDALVEYVLDKVSLKLNVLNLLNKDYYEGVYTGHVIPGTKRAVQLTLATRF